MAEDRYRVPGGSGDWQDDDNWSTSSGGASGASAPGKTNSQADNAIVDINSGPGTLTLSTGVPSGDTPLNSLILASSAGTLDLDGHDIDVDGTVLLSGTVTGPDVIECGGQITISSGTIISNDLTLIANAGLTNNFDTNNATIGGFICNNTAALTLTPDDLTVAGDLTYAAGTFTTTGRTVFFAADLTLTWDANGSEIAMSVDDGVTVTLAATARFRSLAGGPTATVALGGQLFTTKSSGIGSNFWTFTGAVSGSGTIRLITATISNAVPIDVGQANVLFLGSSVGAVLTVSDLITTGTLNISTTTASRVGGMAGAFHVGAITLGDAGAVDKSGFIDFGNAAHTIASLVQGNAANSANAADFGSCYMELSGTIDGTGITFTSDDGAPHIIGGTVSNTADQGVTGVVHCHDTTDGGSNDANVTFDEHAYPNSMALAGVGI